MIWSGKLCKSCAPGKCVECPTPEQPAFIECPNCAERGCDLCQDSGRFRLTECPNRYVTSDVAELMTLARLYDKGLSPVAGGVLDQSKWFIRACDYLWSEQNRNKAESVASS